MRTCTAFTLTLLLGCSQTISGSALDGGADRSLVDAPSEEVARERFAPPLTAASPTRRLVLMEARTLVLNANDVWYGWGDRLNETFGETPPTPVQTVTRLPLDEGANRHFFGSQSTCRVSRNGIRAPQCWGANDRGQLGLGPPGPPVLEPRDIQTPRDISYLDPQKHFAWNGTAVYLWPFNLSPPGFPVRVEYVPQRIRESSFCVAAGDYFSSMGAFDCESGEIEFEQLSDDRANHIFRPTAPIADVASFATTEGGVLAVLRDGSVHCWGRCSLDASQDVVETISSFQRVREVPPIRYVVGRGASSGCAITLQDEVVCWGDCQAHPNLGTGCDPSHRTSPRIPPTRVAGLSGVVELAMSARHACALTRDHELWCWGAGSEHQLVPEQELFQLYDPVRVDVPDL